MPEIYDPCSSRRLLHHKTVGILPNTGKSRTRPAPVQGAATQTHNSLSAQQQAEKCADMGNIPLDTTEAKE